MSLQCFESCIDATHVKAYDDAMQAELAGNSMLDVIAANEPEIDNILLDNFALKDNVAIPAAKEDVLLPILDRWAALIPQIS